MGLENKVALVTGASCGIGKAVVSRLLDNGAQVVAADIIESDDMNSAANFVRLDVSSEAAWKAADQKIRNSYGRLDILINNAGILRESAIEEMSLEDWNVVIGVNLTGVFLGCKSMIPLLSESEGPSIVNLASIDALRGSFHHAAYAASKGGVAAMTRALAVELADRGIRVNAICPGTVETPMVEQMFGAAEDAAAMKVQRLSVHPLGRISTPEEQAAAILFLASPEASFITGTTLSVDGGRAIR